jgi:AraC-like DNA-binding protein
MQAHISTAGQISRRRSPGWQLGWRQLDQWVIVWNQQGHETIRSADERWIINPDSCYLIAPGFRHRVDSPDGNALSFCHCHLDTGPRQTPALWTGTSAWNHRVRQRLPEVIALWPDQLERAWLISAELVWARFEPERPTGDPIERCETWARSMVPEPISVSDLADFAGMGRSAFTRAYHKRRGQGPGAFLRGLRLDWAGNRLRSSGDTVAAVAAGAGYRDTAAFTRAFRAAFGTSPGRWR